MYVVIFRAKLRELDDEYSAMAARLREIAINEFGCVEFHAVTEGDEEVALSYWRDSESIRRWRQHPEHLEAQKLGREKWYGSFSVQIAKLV